MMYRSVLMVLVFLVLNLSPGGAEARTKRSLTWRYNQIWSTAIRYLRIDKRAPIIEQDKKAGYILFEHLESGRKLNGSMEFIPVVEGGKEYVRVDLRLQDMPTYVEVVMIDKLIHKLRDEYGRQPPAKPVNTGDEKSPDVQENKDGEKAAKSSGKSNEPPDDEEDVEVNERDLKESQEE